MPLFDSTLAEIGLSLQLPALAFNAEGCAAFTVGDSDLVSFEKRGTGLLMSVARPVPPHRAGVAKKALEYCHENGSLPFAVRPGLNKKGLLVLTVRFTRLDFTLSEAMRRLTLLRENLGKALEM
ncbi:hypothetical protein LJB81_03060 [Desulfovibrio sp. OttesenSCG-928-M14]|nr:hypothetical protein [Desulfovibrio sp. OttesenSCG-928-M14]